MDGNITGSQKIRNTQGGFDVFINGKLLSPKKSQEIYNHSPDGFCWGFSGSGPAQLALAILLEFTDRDTAIMLYQTFNREIISGLPKTFKLSSSDIEKWIKQDNG